MDTNNCCTRTSPRSILSQLHTTTSPPTAPANGAWTPPLDPWEPTLTREHIDPPTQMTTDWAGNVPYGRSPPGNSSTKASIAGSPPDYQLALEGLRGGFTHVSPPTSPRAAYRQPAQRLNGYQSFGDYLGSSPKNRRRPSMHSQNSHYPPPPHHPQAHFYATPGIDLGMANQGSDDQKSGEVYCCVFDCLPSAGQESTGTPMNVLLIGSEHGLDVYHIHKTKLERIGRLAGLRGSVIGAKILPSQRLCHREVQPLLAVIVHGPFVPPKDSIQPGVSQPEDEEFDPSRSMLLAMDAADVTHYQTTVEVYSLRKGDHVATLFRSPKIEARSLGYHGQVSQPPPIGDLSLQAKGKFVTVSCGRSGEVYVFENLPIERTDQNPAFRCICKVWTRTKSTSSRSGSISSSESDYGGVRDAPIPKSKAAIISLSHRWLAIVPPLASSQSTLHAQIEFDGSKQRIPGLDSHTPTAEPPVNCDLDTPEDGSVINRVARDVAQGALKSAQWFASESRHAWTNYWSRPSEQARQAPAEYSPNHASAAPLPPSQHFPPTHAQDNPKDRAKNQPILVSILDLEKLSQSQHSKPSQVLQPVATFSLQLGCSALSFSPSGLNLITASIKGDEQHVWDLMRMVHGEAGRVGDPDTPPKGPNIRQIARFSRMTEARIIDVVWTEPLGERVAIVTERGTVHIYDLPSSTFQWPPPRRIRRSVTAANDAAKPEDRSNDAVRPQSVGSTFGSALGLLSGKTQTALASVRGRSPSTGGGFSSFGSLSMTAGVGAKGGKAVAVGINRSVSAAAVGTVNTIRHFGENRLALPASSAPVSPGCALWLGGKDQGRIAVNGGGTVKIYSIRQSSNHKTGQRRPSVVADRPSELSLPKGKPYGPNDNARPRHEGSAPVGSFWLAQPSRPASQRRDSDTHPLSYAEIETNAPYQPFHTDRRVNLFIYTDNGTRSTDPHHLHDSSPWVFGQSIPTTQITVGSACHDEDDAAVAAPRLMENEFRMEGNVEEGEGIVTSITRRKKNRKGEGGEVGIDDGEFFEDDLAIVNYSDDRV